MFDMGMGGAFWMPFAWLAFAGLVTWLIVVLVRPSDRRSEDQAGKVLAERYAQGEIDRDEFLARKADLAR